MDFLYQYRKVYISQSSTIQHNWNIGFCVKYKFQGNDISREWYTHDRENMRGVTFMVARETGMILEQSIGNYRDCNGQLLQSTLIMNPRGYAKNRCVYNNRQS